MWWIAIVVVFILLAIVILLAVLSIHVHNKGDYGDGGGTYVGGANNASFFTSANEKAGVYGEQLVNYHLRPLLRADEYLLANVILSTKYGGKAEVDAVLISRKGIFCIETKKWVGHVYGNDEDEKWVQKYDDPYRADRYHRNPVKQCLNHCYILDRILNGRFEIEGAVIFAELEDGWGISSNCAYTIQSFKNHYREEPESELNPEEIKQIYQKLLKYVATSEQLETYKEETRKKYN